MIDYITPWPAAGPAWPRGVAVLGSTGSIGVNTLDVLQANRDRFTVTGLAAGRNAKLLAEQASFWRPAILAVLDQTAREELLALLPGGYAPEVLVGPEGYASLAGMAEADIVVSAQVGAAGLAATHAAVGSGKTVALANKESLVLAGGLLRDLARRTKALVLPVDSEHNAIFQCLAGHGRSVRKLVLTASGGPFRGRDARFLDSVSPAMALNHPNWSMGPKITVDSATMMNKGLEIIEAHHLFGLELDRIEVLVHPQSIVHSMVEFSDSSVLAQAGPPDMRVAIAYCLGWPERIASGVPALDLRQCPPLSFEDPDPALFPCLDLARQALRAGGDTPVVLNAANEVAVEAFLSGGISFTDIGRTVEKAMNRYLADAGSGTAAADLMAIMALDRDTRRSVRESLPNRAAATAG